MSAVRTRAGPVWWWVGGAFLLLLVVVSAFILGRGGRTETPAASAPTVTVAAPPPASSVEVSAAPGAVGEDTANPDGCLGGPDPYTAILPAQAAATLDAAGAAGFARAAVRYLLVQYPRPADYDDGDAAGVRGPGRSVGAARNPAGRAATADRRARRRSMCGRLSPPTSRPSG